MWRMTYQLTQSVFTEFRRDFVSAFFTLAFPLFFMLLFGLQSSFRSDVSLKLAVDDQVSTAASAELIQKLTAQHTLSLLFIPPEDAAKRLDNSTINAVLQIQPDSTQPFQLALQQRGVSNPYVLQSIEAAVHQMYVDERAQHVIAAMTNDVHDNRKSSVFSYLMPALLGMALLQLALFGTAIPLMSARARGSLLHLSMTPVPVAAIVMSHVLVRLGLAAVQLVMLLTIAKFGFGLEIQGNPLLVFASCLLGALMLIATGFLLGGVAPNQQAGNYMVMLVNFPMLFLGNIFFDTSSFGALDYVARLLPITYLSDLNRQLILGNEGRFAASLDWAVLAVSSVLLIVLAVRTFRFSMDSRV